MAVVVQVVFIEGEALIFRASDLQLQPRDVLAMCSLDDHCPRGETGCSG